MTQTATTIAERLAAHRFVLQGTGDNCTAYVRSDGQIEEMITLRDEPEAPEHLTDIVAVGTVEVERSAEGDDHPVIGFTLAEVLAALDHPSDEYALLSLRLDNGLGAGGKRTETDTEALERIAGSAEFGVADESDASVLRAIAERLKSSAEPPKVDTPRLSDAQRLGQFLEAPR